jgi:hypothetical protein
MTVETQGKFFTGGYRSECQMYVLLIFLCFDGMAAGTVYIDESLPEMEERGGVTVAVHTCQVAEMMDIPGPQIRIDIQRADSSVIHDLGYFGFAVAGQAILVRIGCRSGKYGLKKE